MKHKEKFVCLIYHEIHHDPPPIKIHVSVIVRAFVWENEQFGFPTRSDTSQAVQIQKIARSLKSKGKAVTAKLICAFVFAYANCWFSGASTGEVVFGLKSARRL